MTRFQLRAILRHRTMTAALGAILTVCGPALTRAADYRFTTLAGAPPGGALDQTGSLARFNLPTGVAVDATGTVYVADRHNNTIRKISSTGVVSTLAGIAGEGGSADGGPTVATFSLPSAVAVDASGYVYVTDTLNNTVRKIAPNGTVSTLAGKAGEVCGLLNAVGEDARFCRPSGIAVTPGGVVFVADTGNAVIRRIDESRTVITYAGDGLIGTRDGAWDEARFLLPTGLALDASGTLFVADRDAHTIRRIGADRMVSTFAGLASAPGHQDGLGNAARFRNPNSVAIDGAGNLYVADTSNQAIRVITASRVVTTVAGSVGTAGNTDGVGKSVRFRTPYGIAATPHGVVYIADTNNHAIRRSGEVGAAVDLDLDGLAELAVYRPSNGTWYFRRSSDGYSDAGALGFGWGAPGDIPRPDDYDGDGHFDMTVYRPTTGQWFIRYSSSGYPFYSYEVFSWGSLGDKPLSGDFDGDGKSDLVVYRPTTGEWFVLHSQAHYSYASAARYEWGGGPGDIPLVADFDGDGRTDITIYRPSTAEWFVRYSSSGYTTAARYEWGGLSDDIPLVADFDGDGKTDLVVYRSSAGLWLIRFSSLNYVVDDQYAVYAWGLPTDLPIATDFDGDSKTDLVIYRPSTGQWIMRFSSANYADNVYAVYWWGAPGDIPLDHP